MTSKVRFFINDESKPAYIPDYKTIITQCFDRELRRSQATDTNISGVRIALDKTSELDVSNIWVRSGNNVTMGEARTQHFVAQYLQANNVLAVRAPRVYLAFTWGGFGFIVAEYIDGQICENSDFALVAAAVRALINIPSPNLTPRPVGGGLIEHPFFIDRNASIEYESVEELEAHVNGILSATGRKNRVDFSDELAADGLRLCVSDLKRVNFMRDKDGRIVAVDFGGYSFLPPAFFAFALQQATFAHQVGIILGYPQSSTNVAALMAASWALVPFSSNDIGVPKRLRPTPHHKPPLA